MRESWLTTQVATGLVAFLAAQGAPTFPRMGQGMPQAGRCPAETGCADYHFLLRGKCLPTRPRRWLFDPLRIDPATRMPRFADEKGKTAIVDLLGGDAARQFEAIWHHLRVASRDR